MQPSYETVLNPVLRLYSSSALSGYESDPQPQIRRVDSRTPGAQTPVEAKNDYNRIQRGGEVPHYGLRMNAPEKSKGQFGREEVT